MRGVPPGGGAKDPGEACVDDHVRTGKVVSIPGPGKVLVRVHGGGCNGCAHGGTCSLLGANSLDEPILAKDPLGLKVGDPVRILLSPLKTVQTACLLYLLPGICILSGALVGAVWLAPMLSLPEELVGLLLALVMLAVGLIPASRLSRRDQALPVVSGLLKEE